MLEHLSKCSEEELVQLDSQGNTVSSCDSQAFYRMLSLEELVIHTPALTVRSDLGRLTCLSHKQGMEVLSVQSKVCANI